MGVSYGKGGHQAVAGLVLVEQRARSAREQHEKHALARPQAETRKATRDPGAMALAHGLAGIGRERRERGSTTRRASLRVAGDYPSTRSTRGRRSSAFLGPSLTRHARCLRSMSAHPAPSTLHPHLADPRHAHWPICTPSPPRCAAQSHCAVTALSPVASGCHRPARQTLLAGRRLEGPFSDVLTSRARNFTLLACEKHPPPGARTVDFGQKGLADDVVCAGISAAF